MAGQGRWAGLVALVVALTIVVPGELNAAPPTDSVPSLRSDDAPSADSIPLTRSDDAPSLDRIVTFPRMAGTAPSGPAWSPEGERLAFLWNDHGMPFLDVWVVDAQGGDPVQVTFLAPEAGDVLGPGDDTSLEALERRAAAREDRGVTQVLWDPRGDALLYLFRGQVRRLPFPPDLATPSGSPPGELILEGASRLVPSPDGRLLAFLRAGDLWTLDFAGGEERRRTELGVPGIATVPIGAYVRPDAYVASFQWSPDSGALAFEFVDQREVRRVPFPSYLHDEPLLSEVRRPYPGDTDLIRRIGLVEVGSEGVEAGSQGVGAEPRFLDLPDPNRRVTHEFAWSPDSSELLVMQGADVAEDRWIVVADRSEPHIRQIWHDHRSRRVYPLFRATWSGDGERVLFVGDHEEWYRLYSVSADGGDGPDAPGPGGSAATRLTGEWDVASSRGSAWLERRGTRVFFTAARESPYERHVYRMTDTGGEVERLTRLPGIHEPTLSPDGRRLALISSSDTIPSELYLLDTDTGHERRVTHSPLPEFGQYRWIEPRYVSFPSRIDGHTIHARIIEPPGMEPGKRYPVIIGSVYSNTVQRYWNPDRPTSILQQQMAMAGDYITVLVDVRGSVGYGVDFREAFQGDWGGDDLEDLHSAVEYLATLPHVDPDRIGIWGNSYGGLLVLAALFRKPGLFAAGVAGAPAVDVHHFTGFDQHLTRHPDTHPEIFERTLLAWGEELRDPLLILHGVHDDIVPLKTTFMMTQKLTLLGRPFELELVHNSAHWWAASDHYALHTFRRLNDFLRRHVPPGPR